MSSCAYTNVPVSTSQHSSLICTTMAHLSPPTRYYLHENTAVVWGGEQRSGCTEHTREHLNLWFNSSCLCASLHLSSASSLVIYFHQEVVFKQQQRWFVFAAGGLRVTTVTDIEVIVIARPASLVKVGRVRMRGFFRGQRQVRDWNSAGQGVYN